VKPVPPKTGYRKRGHTDRFPVAGCRYRLQVPETGQSVPCFNNLVLFTSLTNTSILRVGL